MFSFRDDSYRYKMLTRYKCFGSVPLAINTCEKYYKNNKIYAIYNLFYIHVLIFASGFNSNEE